MRKPFALLTAGLTLSPVMVEAAACRLENATFRPKYGAEHFEIRRGRAGGDPVFDLSVRRTGETFRFRVDVNAGTGEGTITSFDDTAGQDPRINASFQLLDGNSLKATPVGEIRHLSFHDLGQAFVDFRMRGSRNAESCTSPPSGLWRLAECRGL